MPQRALAPSLSELRRAQVLPPDPNDTDRWLQIQRTQNALDDPYDSALGSVLGVVEGLNPFGREPERLKSLRTSRDTGNFLGQAVSSIPFPEGKAIPMMGVAFGAGRGKEAFKQLRKRGGLLVDDVIEQGLQQRSLGRRPRDIFNPLYKGRDVADVPFHPNQELNEPALHALSIAQQRWPRLFGHLNEVAGVDAMIDLSSALSGKVTRGAMSPSRSGALQSNKLGKLGLNPKEADPNTVGHELLHLKDQILNPDDDLEYAFNKLVHGYENHPQEIRARAMGSRFQDIYDTVMAQGGRARDAQGRNIRVPLKR